MANLKNTDVTESGNIKLPQGSTADRPSNALAGYIRYNTDIDSIEYYDGTFWVATTQNNIGQTSGSVYTLPEIIDNSNSYTVHVFTGNGNFSLSQKAEIEYLIVAGGGGGGGNDAGGGGGGGFLNGKIILGPGSYPVVVGNGGSGGTGSSGTQGENSSAFGLTAVGGGFGSVQVQPGGDGGSGGGSGHPSSSFPPAEPAGSGISGQGNDGGEGRTRGDPWSGGGGGGAYSKGLNGLPDRPGNGGDGKVSSITGMPIYYAGGGGGGLHDPTPLGGLASSSFGGLGGGGHGGIQDSGLIERAKNGAPYTGGGGGGHGNLNEFPGGDGGKGIVIVRYKNDNKIYSNPPQIVRQGLIYYMNPSMLGCFNPSLDVNYVDRVNDISDEGGQGTINGNLYWENQYNGIFRSDTTPAYISTNTTVNNLDRFSLTCWVRKRSTTNAFLVLGTRFGNNTHQSLAIIGGKLCLHKYDFNSSDDINVAQSTTNLDDSEWHYCAITYDNGFTSTYVDGVLEATETHVNTSSNSAALSFNYPYAIGQTYRFYTGDFGPGLVYDRVLSQSEVKQNFEAFRRNFGI